MSPTAVIQALLELVHITTTILAFSEKANCVMTPFPVGLTAVSVTMTKKHVQDVPPMTVQLKT